VSLGPKQTDSHSYQQGLDVLLESLIVEALECLSIVELAGVRVAGRVVLAEDVEPQLLGPPVTVLAVVSAHCPWVQVYVVCRCSPTFWPPPPTLAKRMGHFAGAFSSILPIVKCDAVMLRCEWGLRGYCSREDDSSRRKGRQIFATKRRRASGGEYCRAPMQLLATLEGANHRPSI
jgi:hypothetical protein